jgi:hypothetical protein
LYDGDDDDDVVGSATKIKVRIFLKRSSNKKKGVKQLLAVRVQYLNHFPLG